MIAVLRDLAEVVEHLAYSHTFRSEHTQRRVHELLARTRADLDAAAAAAVPAGQDEPAAPEPLTPAGDLPLNPAGLEIPEVPGAPA